MDRCYLCEYTYRHTATRWLGLADMIRARWLGAAAITMALGSVVLVRACDPIVVGKPTDFSYANHERPRVFVSHRPLIPAPDDELTLRLVPDLPSDISVRHAKAVLRNPAANTSETKECTAAAGGAFECRFSPGQSGDQPVYGGFLELSDGRRVDSRAEYRFSVRAAPIAADTLIEVRVPVNKTQGLADRYRIDTAFARDPENYDLAAFISDIDNILLDGMLADPVYRWRDDQLGFFVFTHDAFVTSYYSGLNTRCGQNPWPLEAGFPSLLSNIEVVGVLHRKAADTQGIEGGVTGSTAGLFRDCAGNAARRAGLRTFSVSTGLVQSPFIAKHEFGHAAFELGDEYTETNGTRNVTPAPAPADSDCCCLVSDDGPGTGTGTDTGTGTGTGGVTPIPGIPRKRCFGPDGPIESPALGVSLPTCGATNTAFLGKSCGAKPEGGCPSLAGRCVGQSAWLGPAPSGVSTQRLNVFPTQRACIDSVALARGHPGVEDPARSLGTCRELCGPTTSACPCSGEPEAWIVDNNPVSAPTNPRDAMASVSASGERHGGTCMWCVETSLCVRWQRALGDDSQKSWETCQAPGLLQGFVAAIGQFIDSLLGHIVF